MSPKNELIRTIDKLFKARIHKIMAEHSISELDSLRKLHATARLEKRRKALITMLHGDPYFIPCK